MPERAKFDGLADDYDKHRPRYPADLAEVAFDGLREGARLVDVGSGSGIGLEWALPTLTAPDVVAIEPSGDMIEAGRRKFPMVTWLQGRGEDHLPALADVDVVMAAQAYQWFDRPAFLHAAQGALRPGGRVVIIQNNRNHAASAFLDAYEGLLEAHSPGYTRDYRTIDIAGELASGLDIALPDVVTTVSDWERTMTVDDFVGMSASSTQAQRAVAAQGPSFLADVRTLAYDCSVDGIVAVPYRTELFAAARR
ncbi:class I SAM-dependent methyltransferase [Brevibacterium sp. NPDC059310]|uniref:class I SAM-dependent methyltransferase n=1 Tax=Brevibacterium sp. NPDC059310 TaxID=3346802 RepID=UPI00367095B6